VFGNVCKAAVSIALLSLFFMVGCTSHAAIADINSDPGRFANKDVTVRGAVSGAFAAMGNGVFQLDDGSGRIWVYSQNFGVPGNGSTVSVTGRVEQGFSFGGHNYGVILRETEARN
jgi:hypothetical protein